jgi:hypothetical protein
MSVAFPDRPKPRPRQRNVEANRRHQRDHYWRQRHYVGVTRRGVQYDSRVIGMLIDEGWLDITERDDDHAIWSAINKFLKDAAGGRGGWR